MDIQPANQQPISDDQELAKVLAGINQQANAAAATPVATDTPAPEAPAEPEVSAPAAPEPAITTPAPTPMPAPAVPGDLEAIKQDALSELRPLVDKLDVSPEEKFDTYLLLLRSTDDQALIAPAHDAAKNITDEARRAQALLDVIKEIDYLSGPKQ
ncbi:MAG TPA: hypothetical protein VJ841_02510 [Candidatus Saccharimonadales bacterium]|nr:hypothetical protein [Candidatus Saccharimonadales bacterium]